MVSLPKIVRYKTQDLASVMPVHRMGRFQEIKVHIKREVAQTPMGEWFAVPCAGDLKKPVERAAFRNAVTGMFKKQALPWVVVYSEVNASMLVVRQEDYEKAKGVAK